MTIRISTTRCLAGLAVIGLAGSLTACGGDDEPQKSGTAGEAAANPVAQTTYYVNFDTEPFKTQTIRFKGSTVTRATYKCVQTEGGDPIQGRKPTMSPDEGKGQLDELETTIIWTDPDEDGFSGEPLDIDIEFNSDKSKLKLDDSDRFDRVKSLKTAISKWAKKTCRKDGYS